MAKRTGNRHSGGNTSTHKGHHQKKETERVIVAKSDTFRRGNLLKNAELGFGNVKQLGPHILYTVGSELFGFVEYLILEATVPNYEPIQLEKKNG